MWAEFCNIIELDKYPCTENNNKNTDKGEDNK